MRIQGVGSYGRGASRCDASAASPRSAGVQLLAHEEGTRAGRGRSSSAPAAGSGSSVEPDRGFDVGFAEFAGTGLCWLPSKGLAGPWYYESDLDDHAWLRVGLGGLFNTAGLVSMGTPQTVPTDTFGFTQRMTARYGTHDRIAVTPASTFAHGQEWDGDRCVLWAEGTVRQEIAYGEHLVARAPLRDRARRALVPDHATGSPTRAGSTRPTSCCTTSTSGSRCSATGPRSGLDHRRPGRPVVLDRRRGGGLGGTRWRTVTDPVEGFTHEGYIVPMRTDADGWVVRRAGEPALRPEVGGTGRLPPLRRACAAGLRGVADDARGAVRDRLRAVDHAVRDHPATSSRRATRLMMAPGESRSYRLEFGILAGGAGDRRVRRPALRLPAA